MNAENEAYTTDSVGQGDKAGSQDVVRHVHNGSANGRVGIAFLLARLKQWLLNGLLLNISRSGHKSLLTRNRFCSFYA